MADRSVLEFNGTVFEKTIIKYLHSHYPDAILLHDRELFSYFLEKDTQIDLIMIHEKGIFVIEAKGWKRWVRGGYNDLKWAGMSSVTSVMDVFSPVNQNFIHIRALRNAIRRELGKEPIPFYNIVCLPDGTVLDTDCDCVVNLSRLSLWIDSAMIRSGLHVSVDEYKRMIEDVTTKGSRVDS